MASASSDSAVLGEILSTLKKMRSDHDQLAAAVEKIGSRVDLNASLNSLGVSSQSSAPPPAPAAASGIDSKVENDQAALSQLPPRSEAGTPSVALPAANRDRKPSVTSRIILTTYPGQSGIDPLPMDWGNKDPLARGPVVVTRHANTIRRRNGMLFQTRRMHKFTNCVTAIGAHGGSYSIYNALAVASKNLDIDHRPDFTNTEPAANIGPFPTWGDKKKIVAMDPFGHLAPWLYKETIAGEDIDIRPTIAVTRAHMKIPELEESVRKGRLVPDGKICLNDSGELAVTKFAVEPVWYLPGVAERFGIGM